MPNNTFGYPVSSISDVPDGDFYLQAELSPYKLYNRQGLPATWLPSSCVSYAGGGDGQYGKPGGTLYSDIIPYKLYDGGSQVSLDLKHL